MRGKRENKQKHILREEVEAAMQKRRNIVFGMVYGGLKFRSRNPGNNWEITGVKQNKTKEQNEREKIMRDFDKHFGETRKSIKTIMAINLAIIVAVLGFGGWVVVKILQYCGVI